MTPARRINLDRLLNPRHAAFIGGRDAGVAIGEARRIGFPGEIWPVNPRRQTLENIACYASLEDLPEAPDAAFIAVPVPQAVDTVRRLASMGAAGAVCYTAGFGEAGADGRKAEDALIEAAGDMALIGPNCYGVINYLDRLALWPFAHGGQSIGHGAAIITQSGMLSSDLTMSQRSVPLTHMISIGNQAVISIEDLVDVLAEHEQVRAIGIHIEGLREVPAFAEAALKAAENGKPIVALKTGSSEIGKSLTTSHTGSLSGADDLYNALFERVGVLRVDNPAALLETLKFICVAGIPKGRRIAGFTCSGGGATMLADHAETIDLVFPQHTPSTASALEELLPSVATVSNPLDYTTPIWGQPEVTGPVFERALTENIDAAVILQDYPAPGLDESLPLYRADGDAFADAALARGTPAAVCSTLSDNLDAETRDHFLARGIAPMQGLPETLDAISRAARWSDHRARIGCDRPAGLVRTAPFKHVAAIDEAEAKATLARAGVMVPDGRVTNRDGLIEAAQELGFPVALKMIGPKLAHKTELGAVQLGLASPEAVTEAAETMMASVAARAPDAVTDHFLIERMQPHPLAELVVSVRTDAQFGLAMTIGSGGILVELVGDVTTLLLPASADDIVRTLQSLRITRLLSGFRGRPAAELPVIAARLLDIAEMAEARRARIVELEINPLFVYEDHICVVDALMHVKAAT